MLRARVAPAVTFAAACRIADLEFDVAASAGWYSAIAGVLAESASVEWALAAPGIACAAALVLAVARRRSLNPPVAVSET